MYVFKGNIKIKKYIAQDANRLIKIDDSVTALVMFCSNTIFIF